MRLTLLAGSVLLAIGIPVASEPVQRTLTFEDRVKAQEAIERVYFAHQIGTTKSFEDAMPRPILEGKVRKYLQQTAALDVYWKTSVTDEMLQRELERMATGTRMPERLFELYEALGNDAFLVKECLARATLVDRLARNFYAFDPTLHAEARRRAERIRQELEAGTISPMADHPSRSVSTIETSETDADHPRWEERGRRPSGGKRSPRDRHVTPLEEERDAFVLRVVLSQSARGIQVASYVVPKTGWDSWWESTKRQLHGRPVAAVSSSLGPLPAPNAALPGRASCADDTWDNGILGGLPGARRGHTAVWTGSEMVVWGGSAFASMVNTGGRYDPATDAWSPTSTVGAPSSRDGHTAVWTGSEMVVWGGSAFKSVLNTGGRYDPATDTWTSTSTVGAPSARRDHTAVWTGAEMVVWGGGFPVLDSGGRYDPATDTWTPTAIVGAPSARQGHTAVWTGSSMLIWGGSGLDTGGRYDPVADTWTPVSNVGAPSARTDHTAVWTGSTMVVWGGSYLDTGGRYDPVTDTWASTSTVDAPQALSGPTAVWTGRLMVVWGGESDSGGRYDPETDTWMATSTLGAPSARSEHTAVWTGSLMVVWGGGRGNTGGRYDPTTDSWTPTSTSNTPSERQFHTAVWTGSSMVVWGGNDGEAGLSDVDTGGRYDPATDSWAATSTVGAPSPRSFHSAVWSGDVMVVWGGHRGFPEDVNLNTGGRYDPVMDTWLATSLEGAPSPRASHAAVWTGSEMLIWAGSGVNTGGRYDPVADSWVAMSTAGAPATGGAATSVWTGTEMLVWGGVNLGGRYDPETDTWAAMSTVDEPSERVGHTAVWTGSVMVIWGGNIPGNPYLAIGGRYDPTTDTWTGTAEGPGRKFHTATWAGNVMVVWGGNAAGNGSDQNSGGRYDPTTDTWTFTSISGAPLPRELHTAVWTGSELIVWGGYDRELHRAHGTGGRYVIGTSVDDDGDGYTECDGDCDDDNAAVYSGAPQVCDGLNNDCSAVGWPALPGTNEFDDDGDGFSVCAGDCYDADVRRFPGAVEACNAIDDDCDGVADDGGDALCEDGNPCTSDLCGGASGCAHTDAAGPCDDGNICTVGDVCGGGVCRGGAPDDCDDGSCCTVDSCEPSTGCVHTPNLTAPVFTVQPSLGARPVLWPPEHGYADFTVADTGAAAAPPAGGCPVATVRFASCQSSQPENSSATADGKTTRDCVYEPAALHLRAERNGACSPIGRVYTTQLVAVDVCGHATTSAPLEIGVWHHRGQQPASVTVYHSAPRSDSLDTRPGTNGSYGAGCGAGSSYANGTTHDASDTDPEMEVLQHAAVGVDDLRLEKEAGGSVRLNWTDPAGLTNSGVTRFHVFRFDVATRVWTRIAEIPRQTLTYQDATLGDGYDRRYKVTAVIE